jgi:ribosome-binding factor A
MIKAINNNRGARVESNVQTLVAGILRDKFSDDAVISGVSLVGTHSGNGQQFIKLFYHSRDTDLIRVQKRLDDITHMVRYELAAKMNQKYVPNIRFEYDDTLERAMRIDELLATIHTN